MFQGLNDFLQHAMPMDGRHFTVSLRCNSIPFLDKADFEKVNELNFGGKIVLPQSCLDTLVRMNIQYPMMFRLTNPSPGVQKLTHCGVQEFSADEGRCFLPSWMMRQLLLNEGDLISVDYAQLSNATFAKFKPQSVEFLEITNPKAVLEIELRKFSCLTKGDVIAVHYLETTLEFLVQEVRPGNAVSIVECDMNVEFDAPEGYVEPATSRPAPGSGKSQAEMPPAPEPTAVVPDDKFIAFSGAGQRLDGKSKADEKQSKHALTSQTGPVGFAIVPENDYKPGSLTFVRYDYKRRDLVEKELKERQQNGDGSTSATGEIKPFVGEGHTLRGARKP